MYINVILLKYQGASWSLSCDSRFYI